MRAPARPRGHGRAQYRNTNAYRFEAKLTLGGILGATRQNEGYVPIVPSWNQLLAWLRVIFGGLGRCMPPDDTSHGSDWNSRGSDILPGESGALRLITSRRYQTAVEPRSAMTSARERGSLPGHRGIKHELRVVSSSRRRSLPR